MTLSKAYYQNQNLVTVDSAICDIFCLIAQKNHVQYSAIFLQLSLKAQDFADFENFSDKSAIFFRLLAKTTQLIGLVDHTKPKHLKYT